jgi:phage tail sheath gpL-like
VIPGETVAICRAISTYTLNSLGFPDPTLLDITTIRALDIVRFQILTALSTKFVRAKNNSKVLNRIKAEVKNTLYLLEAAQVVRDVKTYESGIIVEQDLSDVSRVDIKVPAPVVPGLHVLAGVIILQF